MAAAGLVLADAKRAVVAGRRCPTAGAGAGGVSAVDLADGLP
jgi:hypothetical protein